MAKRTLMALLAGAVLTVTSPLIAQEWGRGPTPRSGVCFYKDPDFSGDYFCVRAGDNVRDAVNGKK